MTKTSLYCFQSFIDIQSCQKKCDQEKFIESNDSRCHADVYQHLFLFHFSEKDPDLRQDDKTSLYCFNHFSIYKVARGKCYQEKFIESNDSRCHADVYQDLSLLHFSEKDPDLRQDDKNQSLLFSIIYQNSQEDKNQSLLFSIIYQYTKLPE
jgi:hypothetical protein